MEEEDAAERVGQETEPKEEGRERSDRELSDVVALAATEAGVR